MNRDDVQDWLNRYIEAWRANERAPIEALFTEDAKYRWRPYGPDDHQAFGREAIVKGWLDEGDDPDSWEAAHQPYVGDGDRAVATGYSRYAPTDNEPERTYHNVFLLQFAADGRCSEFTEYWMVEPDR
jgi:ketosteroid isomerase-like protein